MVDNLRLIAGGKYCRRLINQMKICTITNAFTTEKTSPPRKIGGAEVCAERISRYLAKEGHSVIVITQRPYAGLSSLLPRLEIRDGLKIYSFYPLNIFSIYNTHKKSLFLKAIWRIIDLINPLPALFVLYIIKSEKPDIIHNHILHGFSSLFLLRLLKLTGIPLVQSLHSYGFLCLRCDFLRHSGALCVRPPIACQWFRALSRLFIDGVPDKVISPSHFCLNLYKKQGFFRNSDTVVLPNGVETYAENPHLKKEPDNKRFTILYAGRLVRIKGVHTLIDAFKQLPLSSAELIIAGEGYFEEKLKLTAGGNRRIRFLGKASWVELQEYYRTSDVTVIPSIYYEIFGNVVLESMSHGTPVIGSRIGGITELIRDGFNGFLFEPEDKQGLGRILENLILDPLRLKLMGENAFNFAKEYDIRNHVLKMESIYRQLKDAFPGNQIPASL
ncbi:MAG: glycosyltransferase family 4 protein [Candidatus Omnitrophota bacterium]